MGGRKPATDILAAKGESILVILSKNRRHRKMWVYLMSLIVLIGLTTCEYKFPNKNQMISKPFDLKRFSGIWFETGVYNTLLIPPKLEDWPTKLAYCPTWYFSVKPGENPTEMAVTYYTTSVKNPHEMYFSGTVHSKPSHKIRNDKPRYKMILNPSEREFVTSSGKVSVELAVIDTDYDNYAFIYMIEHYAMLEPRETVIALSKNQAYAKQFKPDWMRHAMGKTANYYYNLEECRNAPTPTQRK